MPCRRALLTVLGLAFVAPAFAVPAAPARPPNIVLITLDTTRTDRMGFLGSTRGLTPSLDSLARQSVVFTRAYAHVPLTTASHATILTGTYPQFNLVNDFGKPLRPDLPYLPDLLHHHGYRTAAFAGSVILDPRNGLAPGFERGFDVYDAPFRMKRGKEDRYKTVERRAADVVASALLWFKKRPAGPFFVWVHLYDAHDPYDPPAPYAQRFKDNPYDGEISYTDNTVGKLLAALRAGGLYDNTLIAVMADHGEAFGEHGERTHGIFLYDETIHVPLVIKLPGSRVAGKRVERRAGLVDILPTILDAVHIAVPRQVQGKSLMAAIRAPAATAKSFAEPDDRPVYSETDYPKRAFGWSALRSLRTGKYLYVQAPRRELYDQVDDPAADHNLAAAAPAIADTLAAWADGLRHTTASATATTASTLDPEQAQKLSALGYVASETPAESAGAAAAPDPKDKIEVANLMHDAILEIEDGENEVAIPKLERVIEAQPNMPIAQMQLGTALTRVRNYERALPVLRHALELQPDNAMGHYELGLAFFETGDWKAAAPEFEATVARAPKWADAQFSLASVYARIDRIPEALDHLNTTLGLAPDHYRANLLKGRILSLQGEATESLPFLRKAVEVQPQSREAHLFLADALEQTGDATRAAQQRQAAQTLRNLPRP